MAPINDATVLVVDDERNVTQLAKLYLTSDGFRVETATNGQDALQHVHTSRPDLVVLDLMMPGMDGWEVCRKLRAEGDLPIIILTARGDDVDKIVGLELGADDYITKPFNPRELVARVKAVLRRYEVGQQATRQISLGNLHVDLDRREVHIGERKVELRAKEFDLLVALAQHPGIVMERERLLNTVWGYDYFGDSRTLGVHITWLREK